MEKDTQKPTSLTVSYIKNNDFRTSFASGVYGGINFQGLIDINFYLERPAIPKKTEIDLTVAETFEKVLTIESLDGVVREVHSGILLDKNTAIALIHWLNEKIAIIDSVEKTK